MIYPWHQAAWQQLAEHWAQRPNAWLLTGKRDTGKTAFARHLAQALLCETPQPAHQPCGSCPSCHLFDQGSHPDYYELSPELPEEGESGRKLLQIKIDAVRAVTGPLLQSSLRGGLRVVLIQPAESMNLQAANALLKMLEEPPAAVVFLLVSHNKDRLLPTIKSRCRQLLLPPPSPEAALGYLKTTHPEAADEAHALLAFHSGAPLFARDAAQEAMREHLCGLLAAPRLLAILDYAADFDKQKWPLALFLDWLHKWLADTALAQQNLPPLYYPQHAQALRQTAARTRPDRLFRLTQALNRLSPYGRHTLSVKMQLEFLLTEYLAFWQNKANTP
ncbi:MAG: DNA polymerase III subunit delta' [Eikenella sp.]|nr:DNA polymerase III subunit delta' [Eikenella sp.]